MSTVEAPAKVQVERVAALALVELCGWKSAANWSNDRLGKKLAGVKDVYNEENVPKETDEQKAAFEAIKPTLELVLSTIDAGGEFEVTGEDVAGKAKKEPKAKKEKAPKEPKAKVDRKPPRAYYSGRVLAKFGLDKVDNEEAIREVGALYGGQKSATAEIDFKESASVIKRAMWAIKGYLDEQASAKK